MSRKRDAVVDGMAARIRELEAENAMNLEAAQALEVERHKERERAEKAEAENARLREAGDDLHNALDLADYADDYADCRDYWRGAKRGTHG